MRRLRLALAAARCVAVLGMAAALPSFAASAAQELGGRVQLETAAVRGLFSDGGARRDGGYVRRAELEWGAALAPRLRAAATLALDGNDRAMLDEAFLTWQPTGTAGDALRLHLGRFDPDFGLDPSTSSSWTPALERSAIFDLAPGVASGERAWGLRVDHAAATQVASASVMTAGPRPQLVLRAVRLGLPSATSAAVWQLGASLALGRSLDDEDGRLRSRLALRASTELDGARRVTLARALPAGERYRSDRTLGLEAAWQHGRLQAQAEWLHRHIDDATRGAPARQARGHTLALAWVLHGAPRRHDAQRARFGRPAAAGSVEAVLRLDQLRVHGAGQARSLTLGLAWTPSRTWRLGANHVWAEARTPGSPRDSGQGLALRVQALF